MNLREAKELLRLTIPLIPSNRSVTKLPYSLIACKLRQSEIFREKSDAELRMLLYLIYPIYKNGRRQSKIIKLDPAAANRVLSQAGITLRGLNDRDNSD